MKTIKLVGVAMSLAVLGLAGSAMGVPTWQGGAVGNWTNAANWVGGVLPAAGDIARISGQDAVVTVDSTVPSTKLQAGYKSSGTDTVNVVVGGVLPSSQPRFANQAGSTSILNINGGTFTYKDGNTAIGYGGTGIANVNSGTLETGAGDDLDFGRNSGSRGELYVNGGTVTVNRDLFLGERAGTAGYMKVSGGTVNITDELYVGKLGSGEVLLNGGSVLAGRVQVASTAADGSGGILTVDAGGLLTTGALNVGGKANTTATMTLNAGAVHADAVNIGLNGVLNLFNAATLDTYTNMNISADGLLVLEGDQNSQVATLVGNEIVSWNGGLVEYDDAKAYDQEFVSADGWLRSKYDTGTGVTEVWTVIPEPGTLGLVATLGVALLFVRRHRF